MFKATHILTLVRQGRLQTFTLDAGSARLPDNAGERTSLFQRAEYAEGVAARFEYDPICGLFDCGTLLQRDYWALSPIEKRVLQ